MDLRIFTEPQQGATYDDILAIARRSEECGFSAFFRSDHYLSMGGDGLPGPTDAWLTLAGLARDTSTIRLGTLVTSATFRLPGPLAVGIAQVDHMSGGRIECGLGAGWFAEEHDAYGIPFPSIGERFDRLSEQLELITGMWQSPPGELFQFAGEHYIVKDSPALPKPLQRRIPVIIGGTGKRRTPELAARYADEFNLPFGTVATFDVMKTRVDEACAVIDRNPKELVYSAALVACVGSDEAEVRRRAAAIGRDPQELRENGAAGTPSEVVEKIGTFAQAGASRIYLQVLDLADLDHVELIAAEVMSQL